MLQETEKRCESQIDLVVEEHSCFLCPKFSLSFDCESKIIRHFKKDVHHVVEIILHFMEIYITLWISSITSQKYLSLHRKHLWLHKNRLLLLLLETKIDSIRFSRKFTPADNVCKENKNFQCQTLLISARQRSSNLKISSS